MSEFKSGAQLIMDERNRQINEEGYDAQHDACHSTEIFVEAAIAYLLADINPELARETWPWEDCFWKPKSKLRNLERAGALIAAAIDKEHELEELT